MLLADPVPIQLPFPYETFWRFPLPALAGIPAAVAPCHVDKHIRAAPQWRKTL